MKIVSIVGARPQFIKCAMILFAAQEAEGVTHSLIHTGQHYDENMSEVFFDELGISRPDYDLEVGSGTHGYQTGEGLKRLEPALAEVKPDVVVVYGDTNATLAGALLAAKLGIPVAHVEAGLRSFDRSMPEEINRVVTDRLSQWLFCPTETAVRNLLNEGMREGVHNVGDVMYDAAMHFGTLAEEKSGILERLELEGTKYCLATIHRDFNTDSRDGLGGIIDGLIGCGRPVVLPAHPRLSKQLSAFGLDTRLIQAPNIKVVDPLGYLDIQKLIKHADAVLTDSGGLQKEAFFHKVPCVTVRPSTEWIETVESGWNELVPATAESVAGALASIQEKPAVTGGCYGNGDAAVKMLRILAESI